MNLINTISEGALKLMFNLNGWNLSKPYVVNGVAYFKPDFYDNKHVIGTGRRGIIYALGDTRVEYAGRVFDSVAALIEFNGLNALNKFEEWVFHEEKEWVITIDGSEWLYTFTTLDKLPRSKTLRC